MLRSLVGSEMCIRDSQSTVIGQQGVVDTLSYPTIRPGVLPVGRHIQSTGTSLRLVEQYGQFQFQGTGEDHGGRPAYQANEGQPYDKYPRGPSSLLYDGQHDRDSSGRFSLRAIDVRRLQALSELQNQNSRCKSQEKDRQAEGGPCGNGMAQGPGRHTQIMQQQHHSITAALRAFRPTKRNNLKRVAECSASNIAQKRQRTRAYIPKYKSANALPRTWTIRQFRTFQRLRTAGSTCPTCTQILPKPTPELVALALHGSRNTSPSASPSTSSGATRHTGASTHLTACLLYTSPSPRDS